MLRAGKTSGLASAAGFFLEKASAVFYFVFFVSRHPSRPLCLSPLFLSNFCKIRRPSRSLFFGSWDEGDGLADILPAIQITHSLTSCQVHSLYNF